MKTDFNDLTHLIIKCAYEVHHTLGCGFLERVYQNALMFELQANQVEYKAYHPLRINYKGQNIGNYYADIIVEDKVIVELKAIEGIEEIHKLQLLNYLKATGLEVGLLINFGTLSMQIKRVINNR